MLVVAGFGADWMELKVLVSGYSYYGHGRLMRWVVSLLGFDEDEKRGDWW